MAVLPDDIQAIGQLLDSFGDEQVLAENVTRLRKDRGWSQDALAAEMAQAGCPIPQSAISKIEKPASGGRRAIQVDEALAFAKVFGTPLPELLLPPGAVDQAVALRLFQTLPNLMLRRDDLVQQVDAEMARLSEAVTTDKETAILVQRRIDRDLRKVDEGKARLGPRRTAFYEELTAIMSTAHGPRGGVTS